MEYLQSGRNFKCRQSNPHLHEDSTWSHDHGDDENGNDEPDVDAAMT